MSYILEALKKSEQQRLAGDVPNLHSGQPAVFERPAPQRNIWLVASIFLALNLAGIAWWFATHPSSPVRSAPMTEVPPTPVAHPTAPPSPLPPLAAVSREPLPPQPKPVMAAPSSVAPAPMAPVSPLSRLSPSRPSAAATPRPGEPEAPPPSPPRGIVAYADLPVAVRSALPPLKIGGYIDGDGEAMLVVDDRLVHEGDEIGAGVKVVKISPDGSVFGFRGYRFRR